MTTPATVSTIQAVLAIARACLPVREAAPNTGRFVDAIIEMAGGRVPESWCADFVYYCGWHILRRDWPLPKTGSCDVLLEFARTNNLLVPTPGPGDVFLVLKTATDAHHTGFVETLRPDQGPSAWQSLEGNSNSDGSVNGVGVFSNVRNATPRTSYVYVRWMR